MGRDLPPERTVNIRDRMGEEQQPRKASGRLWRRGRSWRFPMKGSIRLGDWWSGDWFFDDGCFGERAWPKLCAIAVTVPLSLDSCDQLSTGRHASRCLAIRGRGRSSTHLHLRFSSIDPPHKPLGQENTRSTELTTDPQTTPDVRS